MKAQGIAGEEQIMINLRVTAAAIGLEPEYSSGLAMLLSGLIKGEAENEDIAARLINELPDGLGETYLLDPGFPFGEAQKVDLKTAIRLAGSRFRLDR